MPKTKPKYPDTPAEQTQQYAHDFCSEQAKQQMGEYLRQRTAGREAAFLLPHLCHSMRLLDCGCGTGTLTLSLAEVVAPGQVVGIDINASEIENALALVAKRGTTNVQFETANIYELPFPDHSFDAAFAHTVLQHLGEPVKALTEIRRVLKPGGVFGVREEDQESNIYTPPDVALDKAIELFPKVWKHHGGDPFVARRHRALLREAGFARIVASASAEHWGTQEATRAFGELNASIFEDPHFTEPVIARGWADRATLEELAHAWKAWSEHPDAYFARVCCEAVGWKE